MDFDVNFLMRSMHKQRHLAKFAAIDLTVGIWWGLIGQYYVNAGNSDKNIFENAVESNKNNIQTSYPPSLVFL